MCHLFLWRHFCKHFSYNFLHISMNEVTRSCWVITLVKSIPDTTSYMYVFSSLFSLAIPRESDLLKYMKIAKKWLSYKTYVFCKSNSFVSPSPPNHRTATFSSFWMHIRCSNLLNKWKNKSFQLKWTFESGSFSFQCLSRIFQDWSHKSLTIHLSWVMDESFREKKRKSTFDLYLLEQRVNNWMYLNCTRISWMLRI